MDYIKAMGVERMSLVSNSGYGTNIAILDSGYPARFSTKSCDIDKFGHATEISSILFGGNGITGLCERSKPMFIKVLDDSGRGNVRSVVKGIYEAISAKVDIINLSLGFLRTEFCPKSLEKACQDAYEAGKTIICAAGNDGSAVNWPAALKTTICVGSTAKNGIKSAFSSVGEVDFVAPGQNLPVLGLDGHEKMVSGTSFSAALVTGVVALMLPSMKAKYPHIDCEKVRKALIDIAVDVGAPGYDTNTGYGMIFGNNIDPTVNLTGESLKSGIFGKIIQGLTRFIKRSSNVH